MTKDQFVALVEELQALNQEVKLWGWKSSGEQISLEGRFDAYYDKIKDLPLCLNLTAEEFKSNFFGGKLKRLTLVCDLTAALNTLAVETIKIQVLDP